MSSDWQYTTTRGALFLCSFREQMTVFKSMSISVRGHTCNKYLVYRAKYWCEHTAIHFKTLYYLMSNTAGHSSSTSQGRYALWDQSSNFMKVPIRWLKITTPVEAKVTKLKTITKKGYCMVRAIISKYNRITCIKCVCKNVKRALTIVQ